MSAAQKPCAFCGEVALWSEFAGRYNPLRIDCDSCGWYGAMKAVCEYLANQPLLSNARLNLIHATRSFQTDAKGAKVIWKHRHETIKDPETLQAKDVLPAPVRDIEDVVSNPIPHAEKPNQILRLLATKLAGSSPFSEVEVSIAEVRALRIAGWPELYMWIGRLTAQRLIASGALDLWSQNLTDAGPGPMPPVTLTTDGWIRVEELFGRVGSRTAFVAMSFTLPERAEVLMAIEAAARANNWEAKNVAQHEFTGSIMDRILAEINKARFVVADFTEHKKGVYYEAGYAEGLGIPVIYTVREDQMKEAHFDTGHLNHIAWKTPSELRERLEARIGAVINKQSK